jgi:regulator of protease activity HflC (stomatin/prohibitin superfamily)
MASHHVDLDDDRVSINDLRKNLRDLNEHMDRECLSSAARYGIVLDASLITGIDPPSEVESALAAINTAHNQVVRGQPRAGVGGSEARAVAPRGGDRDAQGAGRGRAAAPAREAACRAEARLGPGRSRPTCAT